MVRRPSSWHWFTIGTCVRICCTSVHQADFCFRIILSFWYHQSNLPSKATKTVCRRKTEKKIGRKKCFIGFILATPSAKIELSSLANWIWSVWGDMDTSWNQSILFTLIFLNMRCKQDLKKLPPLKILISSPALVLSSRACGPWNDELFPPNGLSVRPLPEEWVRGDGKTLIASSSSGQKLPRDKTTRPENYSNWSIQKSCKLVCHAGHLVETELIWSVYRCVKSYRII